MNTIVEKFYFNIKGYINKNLANYKKNQNKNLTLAVIQFEYSTLKKYINVSNNCKSHKIKDNLIHYFILDFIFFILQNNYKNYSLDQSYSQLIISKFDLSHKDLNYILLNVPLIHLIEYFSYLRNPINFFYKNTKKFKSNFFITWEEKSTENIILNFSISPQFKKLFQNSFNYWKQIFDKNNIKNNIYLMLLNYFKYLYFYGGYLEEEKSDIFYFFSLHYQGKEKYFIFVFSHLILIILQFLKNKNLSIKTELNLKNHINFKKLNEKYERLFKIRNLEIVCKIFLF